MIVQLTYQLFNNRWSLKVIILACVILLFFVNVLLDLSFTLFHNSSFYISESLLFSSYWLLFLPFLTSSLSIINDVRRFDIGILLIFLTIVIHLLFYPALVWIISRVFFQHTFDYWQTLSFGLSAYTIITIIIYGFSFVTYRVFNNPSQLVQRNKTTEEKALSKNFITTILISDYNNSKILLDVNEVLYFSANSPYIDIYHPSKKYLYAETLKSLESQLDDTKFVRIHKSHIVSMAKISCLQSRNNGDYDIILMNNSNLRLSRNYLKNFKSKFTAQHQLST